MKATIGTLIALGVGAILWCSTGQIGVAAGGGIGAGLSCITAAIATHRIMALRVPS